MKYPLPPLKAPEPLPPLGLPPLSFVVSAVIVIASSIGAMLAFFNAMNEDWMLVLIFPPIAILFLGAFLWQRALLFCYQWLILRVKHGQEFFTSLPQ